MAESCTADEIVFLPLNGMQLAVFSACETGLSEVAGGEGLLGLQRAFQVAGVRSTVATLWKVNAPTTCRVMQEFYSNYLEKEMSILDSLREAQLWALNNPADVPLSEPLEDVTDSARFSPNYWAAFTLSGNWR
jgi:CHAT domain-containing protein